MELRAAIQNLSEALLETPEFVNLKNAGLNVRKFPASARYLDGFLRKQEGLRHLRLPAGQMQAAIDDLDAEYQKLQAYPELAGYFAALERFQDLVGEVMEQVDARIEKNIR